ncbi:peroxiredoxin [Thiogranum longum]
MDKRASRTLLGSLIAKFLSEAQGAGLKEGRAAPPFELMDQHGKTHRLTDYRDQWLVLYFYPKDDTPGCTTEACAFRDDIPVLKRMGVAVLGISLDDVKRHREFAEKYHLSFPLLSDSQGEVARRYGSLWSLGPIRFAKRHTFIIDAGGDIAKIYRSVRPKQHSDEVLRDLDALRRNRL